MRRRSVPWAVILVAVLAAAGTVAEPAIRIAAHRGGALLWPENGLTAFRNALDLGADLLEVDVHLTADGEVVVIHDPTLDRTTTGTGPVAAVSMAELASVRLRARDGSVTADGVPTLAQVLDLLQPARADLLLEIKADAGRRRYPGIEEKVLALVNGRGLRERVVVMAFEAPTVNRVRELDPTIRTALLVTRNQVDRQRAAPAEIVRWAREAGATYLGVDHRAVDAALVDAVRAAGLRLGAWTVNEEADIRRVLDLGVDVVISDRPDLALRLAGRAPRTR